MKLPFLHRFIVRHIDKTLDNRAVPGPLLCLLMRLDNEAAEYYHERLALDDRLNTDLAPFLGYPQNNVQVKPADIASNDWANDEARTSPWRARIAAACIVILLGLTFAFNFCIVSPYRNLTPPVATVDHHNIDSPKEKHEFISPATTASDTRNKDVIHIAVSFLLLPETNMFAETNQLLT
ncbi:MAG: hypothetical protein Q4G59_01850, partial [Planctomycetia bacterium]|nr:hypothetical protein [Planctomycetia bacterium]